jgi:hypothetical protein
METAMQCGTLGRRVATWLPTTLVALAALAGTSAWAAAPAAQAPAVQAAIWTPKEVLFQYVGFTTKYTCDGLEQKVKDVLTMLGARDVQARASGCPNGHAPEPGPSVYIKMNVLQPSGTAPNAQAVPALWQPVDLLARRDPVDAASDCELVQQLKDKILPLFATRDIDYSATCAAHQLLPGGTRLKAEVLMPEYGAKASAAR